MYSERERISHVFRRLGLGSHPDLAADASSVDAAIERALDVSGSVDPLPELEAPENLEEATERRNFVDPVAWWTERAVISPRPIEERLIWFWHDHFATSARKVPVAYVLWQQHLMMRELATASFDTLLKEVSKDPAMLAYLDGFQNEANNLNENFGREVMELYTIGTANYSQEDVVEASRAFTGWVVNIPYGRRSRDFDLNVDLWQSAFLPFRHDAGTKTLLGRTGRWDMDDALDILLEHPATAENIAIKLFTELVGFAPEPAVARQLGDTFRANYHIMPLVEAIASRPEFVSDEAIRTKIRTPFERLITVWQAFGMPRRPETAAAPLLVNWQYFPFGAPNPAGYPSGPQLVSPYGLVHTFDILNSLSAFELRENDPDPEGVGFLNRLGVYDVSETTRQVIAGFDDPAIQVALSIASPEFAVS